MARASVLITAYNRMDHLKEAIESALDQDAAFPYEIILAKNFDDPDLDAFCRAQCVKLVKYTAKSTGEMMEDGVVNCTGDVILFLDDDDVFTPDKLRETLAYFDKEPKLGLLHNSFVAIDAESKETPDRRHRHPTHDIFLKAARLPKNLIQIIESNSGNVNTSSISMRRSVLMENMEFIRQILGNQDTFFTLLTLIRYHNVILSSKVLTKYRIYESVSKGKYADMNSLRESLLGIQKKYNTSYEVLSKIKPNPNLGAKVEYESIVSRLRMEILEPTRKKQMRLREVIEILDRTGFNLLTLSLLLFKVLHFFSPSLFSSIYVQFRKRLLIYYYHV